MTTALPPPGVFSAQIFVFLSGIDVLSKQNTASKPFISRFFGGLIPSLGTIIKSLVFAGLFGVGVKGMDENLR